MPGNVIEQFNPTRRVRVNVKLNVRADVTLSAPRIGRAEPDETLDVEAAVQGESFHGQPLWYRLLGGDKFVWGGGVTLGSAQAPPPVAPAPAAAGPKVITRPDGTIKPFSVPQIIDVFSSFMSGPAKKKGFIEIAPPWVKDNIVELPVPALEPLGFKTIQVHHLAAQHFHDVFAEIDRQGLNDDLLTCGGTFVPRHISQNVLKPLSSHSWGIAIDLNVAWNGYGKVPARIDEQGTVRRIVPIFNAHGFAWGGHFSTDPDGMHFELARTDV
jgi:hypothetical protein